MIWRGFAPRLCVVLAYVAVAVAFAWPLPLHLHSAFLGNPGGDTGVYVWNQWVFQHEVANGHNPFTTDQIFSLAQRVDLSQHNYTTFLNVLALPLIPALGVVAAFNVVFLIITVMTAVATYALVRRVTDADRPIAWLSGLLFAWSPVLVARSTGHMSLVAAAPIPVFILCLLEAERSGRIVWATLVGLSVAWAAFCDVYFAVYCLMIGAGFVGLRSVRVSRVDVIRRRSWTWGLNILLVCVCGLIVGLLLGRGREFSIGHLVVRVRGLYTPMLVLTVLGIIRIVLMFKARLRVVATMPSRQLVKISAVALLACAGPLSPVLFGLGVGLLDGRFVNPPTFWRSSPRGVDLIALFTPNPNQFLVRSVSDLQSIDATAFVDYTSSLSLVALFTVGIAVWRGYRPALSWLTLTIGFGLLALGPFLIVAGYNTHIPGPWALGRYVPIMSLARSPARFAIVAALGLAVLFAAALQWITKQSGRPRLVMMATALFLVVELCPTPRPLYSAHIPGVYGRIAADPRPVRIIELPFGIRDGVSSVGNYSARSQYFQTLHGKRLVGGYLSRVSKRSVDEVRNQPTLEALLTLSEGRVLTVADVARIKERAPRFLSRSNLGYVVIDHQRASQTLISFVVDAWQLEELERDGDTRLYRPMLLADIESDATRPR